MEKKTNVFPLLTRDFLFLGHYKHQHKTWLPAEEVESLFPVPRAIQFLLHSYLALFFK